MHSRQRRVCRRSHVVRRGAARSPGTAPLPRRTLGGTAWSLRRSTSRRSRPVHIEECLPPLADPDPVSEYVIRVWTPGATPLAAWSLAQWTLTGAASVEDAITWARAHSDGRPTEVLLIHPSGGVDRKSTRLNSSHVSI